MKRGFIKRIISVAAAILILLTMHIPSFAAESSGFSYEIIQGSTSVKITGYTGTDENVIIPDILDGRTVIEISSGAFASNTTVKTVVISSNVLRIMKEAFKNCSSLQSVEIPASVTSIGDSAFANCVSLTSVTIKSASTAIGYYAFEGCTALNSIVIPSTKIGYAAFRNCTSLESITLLDSVQTVDRYAFDATAWYNNQSEGLLTLGKVVYAYTGSEETVEIPDGTLCIANYAFYGSAVKNVVLPDGLYYIGLYAFCNCENMTSLSIPSSVISIGTNSVGYSDNGRYENFKIYCYSDSTAMSWAANNSFTYEIIDECTHEYGEWVVTVEPDCTSGGEKYRRCVKCNNVETLSIDANGHSWSGWIYLSELSCTTDEAKRRTCTVCGENDDHVVSTSGHSWGEWNVSQEPTCTENGVHTRVCSVCGESETADIEPYGHTWTVNNDTDADGWYETSQPHCATEGTKSRVCEVCGYEEIDPIEAPGHTAQEWTVIKDATAVTVGIVEGVCTVCGETFTAETPIIEEEISDDVKMLTLADDAVVEFDSTRTYITGVEAGSSVNDVLVQFNYAGHIVVTDYSVEKQLAGDELIATGCYLILVRLDEDTQKYEYIDTVYVVIKGDVDCNGTVTAADARLALRCSAGLETLSSPAYTAADTDGDGTVTAADARTILRVSSKLESF